MLVRASGPTPIQLVFDHKRRCRPNDKERHAHALSSCTHMGEFTPLPLIHTYTRPLLTPQTVDSIDSPCSHLL